MKSLSVCVGVKLKNQSSDFVFCDKAEKSTNITDINYRHHFGCQSLFEIRSITWVVNFQVHAADKTTIKSISDRDPSLTAAFGGRCKQNEAVLEFLINENEKKPKCWMSRARVYASGPLKKFILRLRFFFSTVIWLGQTCKGNYAASSCICVCFNENMFHGSSFYSIRNRRGGFSSSIYPKYIPSLSFNIIIVIKSSTTQVNTSS